MFGYDLLAATTAAVQVYVIAKICHLTENHKTNRFTGRAKKYIKFIRGYRQG